VKPLVDPANAYAAWLHRKHTKRAIVLLHGFTNNPRQFAVLGPELRADGYNVIAPRFPYHGYRDRMTDALARMRAADVLATALEAVILAAQLAERVDVLGLSLAGTVCAWLAQRVAIGQAVAIAPFFGIRDLNGPANDALTAAIDVLPNAFVWWDPVHRETQLPLHAYPRFATHALAESLSIGEAVRRRGGPLRAQRLQFVLNPGDPIVNNALAERCAATLERGGAAIEVIRASGFPPRHDVIEPTLPDPPMRSVYPFIRDLLAAGAR
jgi:carboxylesterase